jgi:hypothetical protein
MLLRRMLRNVIAVAVKLQVIPSSQLRDEFMIGVGFGPSKFVIEMNNGKDNAQLVPQLQHQPQERDRINPA